MPTEKEYAALAAAVYNDFKTKNKIILPPGWTNYGAPISDTTDSIFSSGFSAAAYRKGNDIVIAFEGTDFLFGTNNGQTESDLISDVLLGGGIGSSQLLKAAEYYEYIKFWAPPGTNITFTGHSLGAGLASIMADWFATPATVFANAPFLLTGMNPVLIAATKLALANEGYDVSNMVDILPGGDSVAAREKYVNTYYVKGEVLSKVFPYLGNEFLSGGDSPIIIGGGDQVDGGSVGLHSIILHAALLISNQLRLDTIALPNLLGEILDKDNLYAAKLEDPDRLDFLTKLLNEQLPLISNTSQGALSLFANDLNKLGKPGAAPIANLFNKALIATVIEAYYFMSPTAPVSFFRGLKNGVGFDLSTIAGIAKIDEKSRKQLVAAAQTLIWNQDPTALGIIQSADKWFIDTGSDGMLASDLGSTGEVLIGGGRFNQLVAGSGTNLLIAGKGYDTLKGGTGINYFQAGLDGDQLYGKGQDKFVITTGDIGSDDIYESGKSTGTVWVNSTQLEGTTTKPVSDFTWVAADGSTYKYTPSFSGGWSELGTLTISGGALGTGGKNQIVIHNFDLNKAETTTDGFLGINLGGAVALTVGGAANPLAAGNFSSTNSSATAEGKTQSLTIYSSAVSSSAQTVKLALTGGSSDFAVNTGADMLQFSGGYVTLTIPAGSDSVTVGLVYTGDPTQAQSAQLTSTVGIAGSSDTWQSNQMVVSFAASAAGPTSFSSVTQDVEHVDVNRNPFFGSASSNPNMQDVNVLNASDLDPDFNSGGSSEVLVGNLDGRVESNVGNDTIYGGSSFGTSTAADTITGGGAPDIILLGSDGANQIYRRTGVTNLEQGLAAQSSGRATGQRGDAIAVWSGNNIIVGGDGNDVVQVGSGNNTIVMGAGADLFLGGVKSGEIDSNWAVARLNWDVPADLPITGDDFYAMPFTAPAGYEGAFQDVDLGNGKKASVPLGTGNDTIYGGTGNSIFYLPNGNNYVDAGGGNDSIWASTGSSTIYGGSGNDQINGGGGNNYIDCESGNDTVINEGGNSTIYGGTGNQTIYSGDATNWASSHADAVSYMEAGSGNTMLFGSAGHDTMIAGSGNDQLAAGDGQELLQGGSGHATMFGGAGNDTIIGGTGAMGVQAGSGKTTIIGGSAADTIFGGSGDTQITAGDGGVDSAEVQISAGTGDTTIHGGAGINLIFGGSGTNVIYVGDGGDAGEATQATAGSGNTTIYGGAGIDHLIAGSGSTYIMAGDGGTADHYTSVEGGSGNSTIVAGSGYDAFWGRSGSTTYVVGANAGTVAIENAGSSDTLQFTDGITMSDVTVAFDVRSDGLYMGLTLRSGSVVTITPGALSTVRFSDGVVLPISDLLFSQFVAGDGTYARGNATLTNSTDTSVATQHSLTLLGDADAVGVGNDVDDVIRANDGSDTLIAGTANDTLVGGGGSAQYVVGAAAGTVTTIQKSSAGDQLVFGAGTTLADLSVSTALASDGSVSTTLSSAGGGSVVIEGTSSNSLDQITFADGSTASLGSLVANLNSGAAAVSSATGGTLDAGVQNLTLTGSADLLATGNDLDDVIFANAGHDTLVAGTASDTLVGGSGSTVYDVGTNASRVTIRHGGAGDVLQFDAGIGEMDVSPTAAVVGGVSGLDIMTDSGVDVFVEAGSLQTVQFGDGNTLTLNQLQQPSFTVGSTASGYGSFAAGAGVNRLVSLGFSNVTLTGNELSDVIVANLGADTLVAGSGSDTLIGGGYADEYVVTAAAGTLTTIQGSGSNDVLAYAPGTTAANLTVTTSTAGDGSTVYSLVNQQGGVVAIDAAAGQRLDGISFSDGSTTSLNFMLQEMTSTAVTSATSVALMDGVTSLTLTGTDDLVAVGNDGPDELTANAGNDTLIAGAGLATLIGGAGNDTFVINNAADTIVAVANEGKDTELTSVSVTLADNVQALTGTGSAALTLTGNTTNAAIITANSGNDRLIAGNLGDTLVSGTGVDTLVGGTGNNVYVINNAADVIEGTAGGFSIEETWVSTAQADGANALVGMGTAALTLTGNATGFSDVRANDGDDTLIAGTGWYNQLFAGAGNDTILIGSGTQVYAVGATGSAGSATYVIDPSAASAQISAGLNDTLQLGAGVTLPQLNFANNGSYVTVTGPNFQATFDDSPLQNSKLSFADGTSLALSLIASGNFVAGTVQFSSSSTTMAAGTTFLQLTGSARLIGTANGLNDALNARGPGGDTLIGGTGNDTLRAGATGSGDTLIAGAGPATLIGGAGSDTFVVNSAADTVVSQLYQGNDVELTSVSVTLGNNVGALTATGSANLTLTGNTTNGAVITANSGNDVLVAGTRDDTLVAGAGIDTFVGGAGNDVFVVNNAADVIQAGGGGSYTEQTSVSATLAAGVVELDGTGSAALTLVGSATGDSRLVANSGNDTLIAGTGGWSDITAGAGSDLVVIGSGAQALVYGSNAATAKATYLLDANATQVQIDAGLNDTLKLGAGVTLSQLTYQDFGYMTRISGPNFTADFANGAQEQGTLQLADGTTVAVSALTSGSFIAGTAQFSSTSTTMAAGITFLQLTGSSPIVGTANDLNDVLRTSTAGGDTLIGGVGNDTLQSGMGGAGNNTLVGGIGSNTFEIGSSQGATISGSKLGDTLVFSPDSYVTSATFTNAFSSPYLSGWRVVPTLQADGSTALVVNQYVNGTYVTQLTLNQGVAGTLNDVVFADGSTSTIDALLARTGAHYQYASDAAITLDYNTIGANISGSGAVTVTANALDVEIGLSRALYGATATLIAGAGSDTFDLDLVGNYQLLNSTDRDVVRFNALDVPTTHVSAQQATVNGVTTVTVTGDDGSTVSVVGGSMEVEIEFGSSEETLAQLLGTAPTIASAINATLGTDQTNLTLTGSANLIAIGNRLSDVITANTGDDTLISGSSTSTLIGGAGRDTFVINNASDVIVAGANAANDIEQSSVSTTLAAGLRSLNGIGRNNLALVGNASDSQITANSGEDTLTGGAGRTTLVGGAGEDTLIAGTGLATLIGGTLMNTFVIDNAQDVIVASSTVPNYEQTSVSATIADNVATLTGTGSGNLVLTGGAGNAMIFANIGNDTLVAGAGSDTLAGPTTSLYAAVSDVMVAGVGSPTTFQIDTDVGSGSAPYAIVVQGARAEDTLSLTGQPMQVIAQSVVENGLTDVYLYAGSGTVIEVAGGALGQVDAYGTSLSVQQLMLQDPTWVTSNSQTVGGGIDNVVLAGTAALTVTGNALNDVIHANSAGDTLIAGTGIDTLIGGSGNDTFVVNNASDVIFEQPGGGTDTEQTTVSTTLAQNVENLTAIGSDDLILTGNSQTNVITANSGNDELYGGSGLTTLIGGAGADTLVGGASATTLIAGSGVSQLQGNSGNDTFILGVGASVNDQVYESTSGNSIEQSAISTTLGFNIGRLVGTGSSAIRLTGNYLGGVISANSGNDTLDAGGGSATLVGGSGTDVMLGNASQGVTSATVYQIGTGYGNTTIFYSEAGDELVFGAGITASMLSGTQGTGTVNGVPNQTIITLKVNGGKSITLAAPAFTQVGFADGSSTTLAAIIAQGTSVTSAVSTTMGAGVTRLTLTGTANISGTGNNLADTIIANSGNDTLIAGSGLATLIGGSGNDTFVVNNAADVIQESPNSGNNTEQTSVSVTLAANVQNLVGTGTAGLTLTGNSINNTITANSGADKLIAGSANATLISGTGVDTLVAGIGNDTFVVNNSADVITAGSVNAQNVVQSSVSYVLAANLQTLTGTGTGAITLTGNSLADTITANSGNDTLVAGSGVATLVGGAGNDTFVVNNSSDAISVSTAKAANVVQTSVSYTLGSNLMTLTATGTSAVTLTGNGLADTLTSNSGADTLVAGSGLATLIGGVGNNTFLVNNAADVITEASGGGTDTEQSSVSVTLAANVEALTGIGSAAITLTGNSAASTITSNGANDTLVAGSGVSTLVGGAGNDTFVVNSASDVITEAANGGTDTEQTSVSVTLAANVENLTGSGTAALTLTGNALTNVITANSGADKLVAGNGNTTLISGTGIDTLVGGTGSDVFVVNNASDVVTKSTNVGVNTEQASVSVTLATNVQNLTGTGSNALTLTGNSLANVITANNAGDTLVAGTGLATLVGGTGNDVFVVNNASDVITSAAGAGNDIEQASVSVTLAANLVNLTGATGTTALTLTGNSLNDVITANNGADKLVAGSGGDTLVSGTGVDTLVGGAGNDVYIVNNASDVITSTAGAGNDIEQASVSVTLAANLVNLTGIGTAALTLTGNALNDVITANSGADKLVAGSGLDTLVSGTGIDTLTGGTGNDVFVVNNASDVITKSTNSGSNTEQASVSVTLAANVQNLTGIGSAALSLTGNSLANVITANNAGDTLIAGTGLATLVGGTGNDVFVVNNASDVITSATGAGNDIEQTSVSVTLAANLVNLTGATGTTALTLTGNSLSDVITANNGADKLVAGSGGDTLVSGTGIDTLVGGTGNDVYVVNNASDVISSTAGAGNDVEQASVSVTLAANLVNLTGIGTAALTLTGNSLNDVITANSGADKLVAGSGLDTLISGAGIDTLVGGTGNDVFVVNNASDVITKSTNTGSNTEQASVSVTLAANVQNLTGIGTAALTLTGNSLANVITANGGNDTLVSGTGADTIVGAAGNYTVNIGAESDTVTLGSGNDAVVSAEGSSNSETMQLGDGNDQITLGSGTDLLTLGNGVDTINVKAGTDTITLGTGQYVINSTGGVDNVVLTNGAENKLWFQQVGSNLQINVLGTTEQITVSNWFTTGTKLNQLTSSDGHTINAAGIGQLVQAMAAFAAPTSAQTAYTAQEQTALAPVLAANWH